MDLKNQLENLFPDHNFKESKDDTKISYNQHDSVICKYEKRKGKPITIIDLFIMIVAKYSIMEPREDHSKFF